MNTQKIYSGMLDNSVELFTTNNVLKGINNGKILDFTEFPFSVIERLKEEIKKYPLAEEALHELYPASEIRRIEQFAKCRFGGLDHKPDFSATETQSGEYWDCPLRGSCKHEGILCQKVKINDQELSNLEIFLIKQSVTELTNDVIAEEMNLPLGTFHKLKKIIHDKFKVQTKQALALMAVEMNLL